MKKETTKTNPRPNNIVVTLRVSYQQNQGNLKEKGASVSRAIEQLQEKPIVQLERMDDNSTMYSRQQRNYQGYPPPRGWKYFGRRNQLDDVWMPNYDDDGIENCNHYNEWSDCRSSEGHGRQYDYSNYNNRNSSYSYNYNNYYENQQQYSRQRTDRQRYPDYNWRMNSDSRRFRPYQNLQQLPRSSTTLVTLSNNSENTNTHDSSKGNLKNSNNNFKSNNSSKETNHGPPSLTSSYIPEKTQDEGTSMNKQLGELDTSSETKESNKTDKPERRPSINKNSETTASSIKQVEQVNTKESSTLSGSSDKSLDPCNNQEFLSSFVNLVTCVADTDQNKESTALNQSEEDNLFFPNELGVIELEVEIRSQPELEIASQLNSSFNDSVEMDILDSDTETVCLDENESNGVTVSDINTGLSYLDREGTAENNNTSRQNSTFNNEDCELNIKTSHMENSNTSTVIKDQNPKISLENKQICTANTNSINLELHGGKRKREIDNSTNSAKIPKLSEKTEFKEDNPETRNCQRNAGNTLSQTESVKCAKINKRRKTVNTFENSKCAKINQRRKTVTTDENIKIVNTAGNKKTSEVNRTRSKSVDLSRNCTFSPLFTNRRITRSISNELGLGCDSLPPKFREHTKICSRGSRSRSLSRCLSSKENSHNCVRRRGRSVIRDSSTEEDSDVSSVSYKSSSSSEQKSRHYKRNYTSKGQISKSTITKTNEKPSCSGQSKATGSGSPQTSKGGDNKTGLIRLKEYVQRSRRVKNHMSFLFGLHHSDHSDDDDCNRSRRTPTENYTYSSELHSVSSNYSPVKDVSDFASTSKVSKQSVPSSSKPNKPTENYTYSSELHSVSSNYSPVKDVSDSASTSKVSKQGVPSSSKPNVEQNPKKHQWDYTLRTTGFANKYEVSTKNDTENLKKNISKRPSLDSDKKIAKTVEQRRSSAAPRISTNNANDQKGTEKRLAERQSCSGKENENKNTCDKKLEIKSSKRRTSTVECREQISSRKHSTDHRGSSTDMRKSTTVERKQRSVEPKLHRSTICNLPEVTFERVKFLKVDGPASKIARPIIRNARKTRLHKVTVMPLITIFNKFTIIKQNIKPSQNEAGNASQNETNQVGNDSQNEANQIGNASQNEANEDGNALQNEANQVGKAHQNPEQNTDVIDLCSDDENDNEQIRNIESVNSLMRQITDCKPIAKSDNLEETTILANAAVTSSSNTIPEGCDSNVSVENKEHTVTLSIPETASLKPIEIPVIVNTSTTDQTTLNDINQVINDIQTLNNLSNAVKFTVNNCSKDGGRRPSTDALNVEKDNRNVHSKQNSSTNTPVEQKQVNDQSAVNKATSLSHPSTSSVTPLEHTVSVIQAVSDSSAKFAKSVQQPKINKSLSKVSKTPIIGEMGSNNRTAHFENVNPSMLTSTPAVVEQSVVSPNIPVMNRSVSDSSTKFAKPVQQPKISKSLSEVSIAPIIGEMGSNNRTAQFENVNPPILTSTPAVVEQSVVSPKVSVMNQSVMLPTATAINHSVIPPTVTMANQSVVQPNVTVANSSQPVNNTNTNYSSRAYMRPVVNKITHTNLSDKFTGSLLISIELIQFINKLIETWGLNTEQMQNEFVLLKSVISSRLQYLGATLVQYLNNNEIVNFNLKRLLYVMSKTNAEQFQRLNISAMTILSCLYQALKPFERTFIAEEGFLKTFYLNVTFLLYNVASSHHNQATALHQTNDKNPQLTRAQKMVFNKQCQQYHQIYVSMYGTQPHQQRHTQRRNSATAQQPHLQQSNISEYQISSAISQLQQQVSSLQPPVNHRQINPNINYMPSQNLNTTIQKNLNTLQSTAALERVTVPSTFAPTNYQSSQTTVPSKRVAVTSTIVPPSYHSSQTIQPLERVAVTSTIVPPPSYQSSLTNTQSRSQLHSMLQPQTYHTSAEQAQTRVQAETHTTFNRYPNDDFRIRLPLSKPYEPPTRFVSTASSSTTSQTCDSVDTRQNVNVETSTEFRTLGDCIETTIRQALDDGITTSINQNNEIENSSQNTNEIKAEAENEDIIDVDKWFDENMKDDDEVLCLDPEFFYNHNIKVDYDQLIKTDIDAVANTSSNPEHEQVAQTLGVGETGQPTVQQQMMDLIPPRIASVDSGFSSPLTQIEHPEILSGERICICFKKAELVCQCGLAIYCSSSCQLKDWTNHSKQCITAREANRQ